MYTKLTLFEIVILSRNGRKIHKEVFCVPFCGVTIDEIIKSSHYSAIQSIAQNICEKRNGYTWRFCYIAKRYKKIA